MEIISTDLEDLFLLKPKIFEDNRGYFFESYKAELFHKFFPKISFVQDNESQSDYGVLRGLHYQFGKFSQTKLVRVIHGKVLDVVVDLRNDSPTFGVYKTFILSSENKLQLLIPNCFAHGFLVLSDKATFSYKVDNHYNSEFEDGIIWNDSLLNIQWPIPISDIKVSEKDNNQPTLSFDKKYF